MEHSESANTSMASAGADLFARLQGYEQRSLAHDAGESDRQQKISNWSGIAFRLRGHDLACRIDAVEEIIALPPWTPIPGTRDWLLGIANVRGNLVPISDLGGFLFGSPTATTSRSRLLLTRFHSRLAGLIVDEVLGQRHFHTDDLEADEAWNDTALSGVVEDSFPMGERRWGVFHIERLGQLAEFMNGARDEW